MLLIRGLYYIPTNQKKYYNNKLIKIKNTPFLRIFKS